MHVHPVELRGKKSGLVSACTCPELNDNVFGIVGIFGKQEYL